METEPVVFHLGAECVSRLGRFIYFGLLSIYRDSTELKSSQMVHMKFSSSV